MKRKEKRDLHNKNVGELLQLLKEKQIERMKVQMEHSLGKVKNVRSLRTLATDVAVIKTIIQIKNFASSEKDVNEFASSSEDANKVVSVRRTAIKKEKETKNA